jgi:hypothetical protein
MTQTAGIDEPTVVEACAGVAMTEHERRTVLVNLICFSQPLAELEARLAQFPWDCDEPLVVLTTGHLRSVLDRFLAGEMTAEQVEEWANLIELRDDIDYTSTPVIQVAVFRLANPYLAGVDITAPAMRDLLQDLGNR